jgi:hypothetical protein
LWQTKRRVQVKSHPIAFQRITALMPRRIFDLVVRISFRKPSIFGRVSPRVGVVPWLRNVPPNDREAVPDPAGVFHGGSVRRASGAYLRICQTLLVDWGIRIGHFLRGRRRKCEHFFTAMRIFASTTVFRFTRCMNRSMM